MLTTASSLHRSTSELLHSRLLMFSPLCPRWSLVLYGQVDTGYRVSR